MKRTRIIQPKSLAEGPPVMVRGRELARGAEVSIRGERGRFRFVKSSLTSEGRIVCDFIGPSEAHAAWRSFYVDRIKTVHRIKRLRASVSQ
ncbi:MAG: DUF7246 family protein [Mycobacterium sp.]